MPLRRLGNESWRTHDVKCVSPEHEAPRHIFLERGTYEWKCPECGGITIFTVDGISYIRAKIDNWDQDLFVVENPNE